MSILPPATLGILGGGQLGRMFVTAARTMGYEVIVLDPDENSPAGSMATEHLNSVFTDTSALDYMVEQCAVITTEFENIPVKALEYLARSKPVFPSAQSLAVAQNRIKEKTYIQSLGLKTSTFIAIESESDLVKVDGFEFPAILKTATLGYDGKGQVVCNNVSDVEKAFAEIKVVCVLEQKIDLRKEVSVVLSRDQQGETFFFPVAENDHVNGVLDVSVVPADISNSLADKALNAAKKIADGLDYCGVLAVEFFISTSDDLLVNEMAPRPHNSGHFTLDACYSSQFEQQVKMICGLPSGNCELHTPVAMLNLLGDIWPESGVPDWKTVMEIDKSYLHLYGKKEARPGRKMGHINFLSNDLEIAKINLKKIRNIL
ncbi:MAG: 5-(carboxyamino)imidazole ribonucleotide synthase [Gammaproteobacteria bacterium]|jgi:5-(carboxyamino)imidazole ribonucleotide synthase|nr:5-(carboxyamino)imidazole ribonucleotide synthase [Gammaproteobacteria bacterium]MBT3723647.1 5-(carboxyamino)imidazole ribonucleotide synthase [Gammaproteobacteria bacterium]MBT4077794.1 5-(carboxyamino)imidazole ribonucleotide synthase [Gammaproteobacteria bacterium]MBT4194108.1 5-(carboxyamino)imidazole ribonucleotide synthase [Gammaproteobacteria bacterium]MBT4450650.1 5-(carboxyamino)imidazole ribonucleotide synthase [Gammaproteobacteria bacterium]